MGVEWTCESVRMGMRKKRAMVKCEEYWGIFEYASLKHLLVEDQNKII